MGSLNRTAAPGLSRETKDPEFMSALVNVVNNILAGKLHNTGSMTLALGGVLGFASTTVSDARCGVNSVILLQPSNANGSAALTNWRVSTITDGSFVITHVSTSTSDATADYAIFG